MPMNPDHPDTNEAADSVQKGDVLIEILMRDPAQDRTFLVLAVNVALVPDLIPQVVADVVPVFDGLSAFSVRAVLEGREVYSQPACAEAVAARLELGLAEMINEVRRKRVLATVYAGPASEVAHAHAA